MNEDQYKIIRGMICSVLVVNILSIGLVLVRMEYVKCHCSSMKVEASGNTNNIHVSSDPIKELAQSILEKEGKVNANMSRPIRSEGPVER